MRNTNHFITYPSFTFDVPAFKRLIEHAFVLCELPSLIESIFSNKDESDMVSSLHGDDVQTFIDVIDEVRPTLFLHHEMWSIESTSTRRWTGATFHHRRKISASNHCTGSAAPTRFFQEPCRSNFAMIERASRCTGVASRTCGRGNTWAGMSQ